MGEIIFKIWYIIAILPLYILMEGTEKFAEFLKKKNMYSEWDMWHSVVIVLIVLIIILWLNGYSF